MSTVRVTSYARDFSEKIRKEFERRTRIAAERVRAQLRLNLSHAGGGRPSKPGEFPHKQTGRLMSGVRTVFSKSSPYSFRVINRAPYNDALEGGTVGGQIVTPKSKGVLRFNLKGTAKGGVVFTKKVRRGSIAARHQGRKTLEQMREVLKKIYTRGIADMMKGNRTTIRIG